MIPWNPGFPLLSLTGPFCGLLEHAEGHVEEAAGFGGELLAHGVDGSAGAGGFTVFHQGVEKGDADLLHEIPAASFPEGVVMVMGVILSRKSELAGGESIRGFRAWFRDGDSGLCGRGLGHQQGSR